MTHVPLVRSSAYAPFVQFMENLGAPVESYMADELVPGMAHEDPETLVPAYLAHAFLEKCARAVGLPDFGFVVGQDAHVTDLGAFGRSLQRSLTLNDALAKVRTKYPFFTSVARSWCFQAGTDIHFCHEYLSQTGPGRRFAQQSALLFMRDVVRLALGPNWQPAVAFSTDPAKDGVIMQRAFGGAHIRYAKHYGFAIPAQELGSPIGACRRLGGLHSVRDVDEFEQSAPSGDLVGSVGQVISAMMRYGHCRLDDIAMAIGMRPRTLQRRLTQLNTDFSEVLAQVRFEAALRMANDPRARIIDIAYELGYADPANFTRAFRRWTGISPKDYCRLRRDWR